jgi:ribonuclease VapC
MVLDSSALLAILQNEPERRAFLEVMESADSCALSAASVVETSIVVEARWGLEGVEALDHFLEQAAVTIVPVDAAQAAEARRAYFRYGKGRHAAGLNFGDCFSYALARSRREPLLYKGSDFAKTDLIGAI